MTFYLFIFFASPKKRTKKKETFTKVFFMLFYQTHKNRLKSTKILPRIQNFLTRFLNYTAVKDFDPKNDCRLVKYFKILTSHIKKATMLQCCKP